ncbi:hypothetical protein Syun_000286 [Stephania yunnanensis]|uniref:Uncharacterized protein n=1 Tax=Stephania yunnanensis TaxID=152371 RepID=A0AAP0Q9Q1_9MAGN
MWVDWCTRTRRPHEPKRRFQEPLCTCFEEFEFPLRGSLIGFDFEPESINTAVCNWDDQVRWFFVEKLRLHNAGFRVFSRSFRHNSVELSVVSSSNSIRNSDEVRFVAAAVVVKERHIDMENTS